LDQKVEAGHLALLLAALLARTAGGTTYYVDNAGGNDANSGTNAGMAWQTLAKVGSKTFQPGDQILFKAGGTWPGELDLNGSGNSANPIIVSQYGTGNKPFIDGAGYESAVRLQEVAYWEVNDLEIINNGGPTQSGTVDYRVGVLVENHTSAVRNHIYLRNLTIHDIFPESGAAGHGIHVIANGSSTVNTYFNDVRVENCQISLTGHYGIRVQHGGSKQSKPGYIYNQNIIIRNNTFTNTGGPGVQTHWCEGVLFENNVVDHSGASVDPRQSARGSGYWPGHCHNVLVQSNEFRHARGIGDSCGMHIDSDNRDVTVQYNLSLDNEGGFVEILGGCLNSIYRYNVSVNDGSRVKGVNGAIQDGHLIWVSDYYQGSTIGSTNSMIYNNTMYVGPGITNYSPIVQRSVNTYIWNNIFYLAGKSVYSNSSPSTVFNNNLWYGNLPTGVPFGAAAVFADPLVAKAGGTNAADYLLNSASPAIGAGMVIANNGGQDFWGNPLPVDAPCIGAYQRAFSTVTPHGVPAAWFLSYNLPVDDLDDADLDGIPAWQEYYAGTSPTNSLSFLQVIGVSQIGEDLVISWLGGTSGWQGNWSMCVSSNLTDWSVLESKTIPRNPSGTNIWVHTNGIHSAAAVYYRPCVEAQ